MARFCGAERACHRAGGARRRRVSVDFLLAQGRSGFVRLRGRATRPAG
jgi:hypothetical protein